MECLGLSYRVLLFAFVTCVVMGSEVAWAQSQCPQSFISSAKWDGTDVFNGMPINQTMCSQMPTMACCPEFMAHQAASRPPRRHIEKNDLAPFPASAPKLSDYESLGYCSGVTTTVQQNNGGQNALASPITIRHYDMEASDNKGFFQLNIKTVRNGQTYNCPALNDPSVAKKNRPINGPPLFFINGETAEIVVKNTGKTPTSIHWHGLEIDNPADGVPGITQPAIQPGEAYTYKFKIHQDGTYWYHPHTLQEQEARGAFIIFPKGSDPVFNNPNTRYHHEQILVLTDYLKMKPEDILANLQQEAGNTETDGKLFHDLWTAYKTDGVNGFKRAFNNLKTMGMFAMDKADVYYSDFFVNDERCLNCGPNPTNPHDQSAINFGGVKPGERIRLRIINGSTSSYFYLDYANNSQLAEQEKMPILIVAKDGKNVRPVEVDQLYIGMGECYDIIVEVPDPNKGYELRVKSIDDQFNKRIAKVIIGSNPDNSNVQAARDVPVTTFGEVPSDSTLQVNYDMLKALNPAPIDPTSPISYYEFSLQGNMETYYWQIKGVNGTKLDYHDNMPFVKIPKNSRIHVTIHDSMMMGMMNHPMHLHGQFFRLIKKSDSPADAQAKAFMHTATVFPGSDLELEFYSGNTGSWVFHCHNLYHMASSMMLAFVTDDATMPMHMGMAGEGIDSVKVDAGVGTNSKNLDLTVSLPNGNKALNQINVSAEDLKKPGNDVLSASGSFLHCIEPNKCVTLNLDFEQYSKDGKVVDSSLSPGIGYLLKPFNNNILAANVAVYANKDVKSGLTSEIPVAPYTTVNGQVGCEGKYCKDLEAGFSVEIRPRLNLKLIPIKCTYKKAAGGTYCGAEVHYLFSGPFR